MPAISRWKVLSYGTTYRAYHPTSPHLGLSSFLWECFGNELLNRFASTIKWFIMGRGIHPLIYRLWTFGLYITKNCHINGCHYHRTNQFSMFCLKNGYKFLNICAIIFSPLDMITIFIFMHILQYMGKIFCLEFQWIRLIFQTNYLTHALKYAILYSLKMKTSQI